MPEDREINTKFDVYQSICCGREIIIREGAMFPDCPNHPHLPTIWKPIKADVVDLKVVVPQNGEANQEFGIYKSVCCGAEIVINIGSMFPDCPKHPKLTTTRKPIFDDKIIKLTGKNKSESDPAA